TPYTSVRSVAHLIRSRSEERVIIETVGERGVEHLRESREDAGEGPRKNIGGRVYIKPKILFEHPELRLFTQRA
ncbi:MAG: hypothetical protein NTY03_00450, partial [Candidatus Bathyarchaeota archaeon]|nr:hypothetical protein [Candidatus Bathyarchaeota archaeon]